MGRIILCRNAFEAPTEVEHFGHVGPFIDWLQKQFPEGFDGAHAAVSLNGQVLNTEDFDYVVTENDVVAIALTPQWVQIGLFVLQALISIAVSLAINFLFGKPKTPGKAPAASPTYSFGAAQNEARLGAPIPVIYGDVILVPLYAMQPYTYYKDNSQYLVLLFAVSKGDCLIDDVLVADSRVADMPVGIVRWKAYKPSAHLSTIGTISTDFGIYENVVTAPEVQDLDMQRSSDTVYSSVNFDSPNKIIDDDAYPESFKVGATVTITGSLSNDGNYTILTRSTGGKQITVSPGIIAEAPFNRTITASLTVEGTGMLRFTLSSNTLPTNVRPGMRCTFISGSGLVFDTTATYIESVTTSGPSGFAEIIVRPVGAYGGAETVASRSWTMQMSAGPISLAVGAVDDGYRGWYAVCKPGVVVDKIEIDINFPSGIYLTDNDGKFQRKIVSWNVEYQPIDNLGAVTGPVVSTSVFYSAKTPTAQRKTYTYPVTADRYRVRLRRITINDNTRVSQSAMLWVGLKGFVPYSEITESVYGNTTLLAVEAKASSGLSSNAQLRFRCKARREIPTIASSFATKAFTTNPADIFCDILRDTDYGGGRDVSDLDLDSITDSRDAWIGTNGFNAIFDGRNTLFDAANAVLGVNRGKITAYDRKFGVLRERPRLIPTTLFGPTAMLADTFLASYLLSQDYEDDGVRVAYRDPDDFLERYALYPPTSLNPAAVTLLGCTNYAHAYGTAKYFYLQQQNSRVTVQFDTELDGRVPELGDRVVVSHPSVRWGTATRVLQIQTLVDGYGLVLESPIYIQYGAVWVYLRGALGNVIGPLAGTIEGAGKGIKVAELPDHIPDLDVAQDEPMTVAYGFSSDFAKDYLLTELQSQDSRRLTLSGTQYNPALYVDTIPLPEWSS